MRAENMTVITSPPVMRPWDTRTEPGGGHMSTRAQQHEQVEVLQSRHVALVGPTGAR